MRNDNDVVPVAICIQRLIRVLGNGKRLNESTQRGQIRVGIFGGAAAASIEKNQDAGVQLDVNEGSFGPFIVFDDAKC
jgi:hypothetical protein